MNATEETQVSAEAEVEKAEEAPAKGEDKAAEVKKGAKAKKAKKGKKGKKK